MVDGLSVVLNPLPETSAGPGEELTTIEESDAGSADGSVLRKLDAGLDVGSESERSNVLEVEADTEAESIRILVDDVCVVVGAELRELDVADGAGELKEWLPSFNFVSACKLTAG